MHPHRHFRFGISGVVQRYLQRHLPRVGVGPDKDRLNGLQRLKQQRYRFGNAALVVGAALAQFPDLAAEAGRLEQAQALDGMILAHRDDHPDDQFVLAAAQRIAGLQGEGRLAAFMPP